MPTLNWIGKEANKAGDSLRYFMVFDHIEMDGAYTKDRMIEMLKVMLWKWIQ
jgi:hypothetical protein